MIFLLARFRSHLRRCLIRRATVSWGFVEAERLTMSASVPEVTFKLCASGDGTWYVEIASPGIACEDVGDFRSKASAEAWIRDNLRSQPAGGGHVSGAGHRLDEEMKLDHLEG
jgi:hypothetical protein